MKKTHKKEEIEARIGENLETFLRREYVKRRKASGPIAKALDVSGATILYWIDKFNMPKRTTSESKLPKNVRKPKRPELYRMYVTEERTVDQIAVEIGVSSATANRWLHGYSIPIRTIQEIRLPKGVTKPPKRELQRLYVKERKPVSQLVEFYKVSDSTIWRWLKSYDISIRSNSESKLPPGFKKPTKSWLTREYVHKKRSVPEIANQLSVGSTTVYGWLDNYDIERRDKRGIYEDKTYRKSLSDKVIELTGKSPQELIAKDFQKTTLNGLPSYYGVVKWYKEKNGCNDAEAIDKLLGDLYGLKHKQTLRKNLLKNPDRLRMYLEREYVEHGKTSTEIAKQLGVNPSVVVKDLKRVGIHIRDNSEAHLKFGIVKPTKDQLRKMYVKDKRTPRSVGKEFGISSSVVHRLLEEYGIEKRSLSEAKLYGKAKPTKEDLERLYVEERLPTTKIANRYDVHSSTVGKWLKAYGIPRRTVSEYRLPEGFVKSKQQFLDFLAKDETARSLAATALILNGQGVDVEQIIAEVYGGKFKGQASLHLLLEQNAQEIYALIGNGITSLGSYLGEFNLGDRRIVPTLIGQAINSIPEERVTQSLEERLVRILRIYYGPRFNQDPEGTLTEINAKFVVFQGKLRRLYEGLYAHYKETFALARELR